MSGTFESPESEALAQQWTVMARLVGLGPEDHAAIAATLGPVSEAMPQVLDAAFAQLIAHDETRAALGAAGKHGEELARYLELRKDHLAEWYITLCSDPAPAQLIRYLRNVARRHSARSGDPQRVVAPHYLLALTGFLQAELTTTIVRTLASSDAALAGRAAAAWNKLLMLQLNLFFDVLVPGYLGEAQE